jgi:hypothetical protein
MSADLKFLLALVAGYKVVCLDLYEAALSERDAALAEIEVQRELKKHARKCCDEYEARATALEKALALAKQALETCHIYSTKDGVWINSRVKGSAMWGLQDVDPAITESFAKSAELRQEALATIDAALSPKLGEEKR